LIPFYDIGSLVRSHRSDLHQALDIVLDGGHFVGGKLLEQFEREFAGYQGNGVAIGVGNGLDALRLVLEGWGVGPGDEVIVPGFTFYATWLAVMQVGATPVFVDVESNSANLNPDLLPTALTRRTKALIVVHLYGTPARINEILEFARGAGIKVLEDSAQAHGAEVEGEKVGTFGQAAAFSFYPTKNLGALGDGGAITTADPHLESFVRSRRSYGVGDTKYEHNDYGWNTRLDSMQASFLGIHLKKLDAWNARRMGIARTYLTALGDLAASVLGPLNSSESVWHHFVLKCKNREGARLHFEKEGVLTDIHYPYFSRSLRPINEYLLTLGDKNKMPLPVSELLSKSVLSLPMGPWMTEEQVAQVAGALSMLPRKLILD
jgi:dTDP-4-amino-4,6-dideoxygalactose transaminase